MGPPFEVAVIGAGIAGLFLADELRRRGICHTVYEQAREVGGTWRDNTYPGLYVDVVTRGYELPFARGRRWSRRYAPGREIQDYLVRLARGRRIVEHVRFGCEIRAARYDGGRWVLDAADGRTFTADVVVSATGFLRVPVLPSITGRDSFAGPAFHSACWDHSVELDGRRVGVIGAGSSGVQIVTELGMRGVEVTHFIRRPQWIMVRPNPAISWWERMVPALPGAGRLWDRRLRAMKVRAEGGEGWRLAPGPERDGMRRRYLAELARQVRDPGLRARLTPDEEVGCRRIPKSEHFYQVLQRPNVTPVTGPLTRITPAGVIDGDGRAHDLDVLVFATGFDSHAYMRPMRVEGISGVTVDELWADGVYSYRGVALPGMPNLFLLNGPFAPVNVVPAPAILADEVGYLLRLLDVIRARRVALAPTTAATLRFCDTVREALPNTTFVACSSWFTDRAGLPIVWPWTGAAHTELFAELSLDDFALFPVGAAADR
ncbi:flavin-containing monooxygenase [Actinophytocola algeriensis]|uniref:Cation diffusion facilitator CzcD-associated flavoprotein CzcO n=1 Tax=Actinophytocola algeriensis TaxID=1768010 RepID=A0A7W7Q3U0_9PSEU|nr:NAD(P)/FAD-dependent oxidoreductase [Actinophytocola algeriensis]MBB4906199.1 cation diffusion facilitator CzcD-associated flavoprotein CzcO [Actinophytocola algeriensis]MBE1472116.1 cation diffusion facilitator CzcD-associated flavoprotein CzcO [Actinophytocola algeriensis]